MGGKRKDKKKSEKMSWAELTGPTRDIVKVPHDWTEMMSDEDEEDIRYISIDRTNLPNAPRGAQEIQMDKIPFSPPFILYMSGIPFTHTNEQVIAFFNDSKVLKVNMSSEDGRNRGTAVVEFEDRTSLINGLRKDDATMGTRQVRITLENPRDRGRMDSGRTGMATLAALPDNWRSAQRKASDLPPPSPMRNESSPQISGFSRTANRQLDMSRAPYRGRFSDDSARTGRSTFASVGTWSGARGVQREPFNEQMFQRSAQQTAEPEAQQSNAGPITADDLRSSDVVRKVDTNAFRALISDTASVATARSQSIFGKARPVDTTSKLSEVTQKMERLQPTRNIQDGSYSNKPPAFQQSERPSYRPSKSEDLRSTRHNPSMSTYSGTEQTMVFRNTARDGRRPTGGGQSSRPPAVTGNRGGRNRPGAEASQGQLKHRRAEQDDFSAEEVDAGDNHWTSYSSRSRVHSSATGDTSIFVPSDNASSLKMNLAKNKFSSLMTDYGDEEE